MRLISRELPPYENEKPRGDALGLVNLGHRRNQRSEMIVDAAADNIEIAFRSIDWNRDQIVDSTEIGEEIFDLGRPVRRKHVFRASASGPAGLRRRAVESGHAGIN
jgi:hypothetical protein